jgi:hypothetical protein
LTASRDLPNLTVDMRRTHNGSTTSMRIPAWRVALTGGAIVILAVAGIGFAAASGIPSKAAVPVAADSATTDGTVIDADLAFSLAADVESNETVGARDARTLKRLLKLGRHLVHADVTVTDKDGNLVHLQLDHGTVQSIGSGTLVISETGGGTETVSTSDATKVHLGRADATLSDVKVGAEIFVQSRIDGGTTLAKRIIVIPAGA